LSTSTTPSAMLDEYLDVFDDSGWLISEADKEGYEEKELSLIYFSNHR